jgi:hypothetical protein
MGTAGKAPPPGRAATPLGATAAPAGDLMLRLRSGMRTAGRVGRWALLAYGGVAFVGTLCIVGVLPPGSIPPEVGIFCIGCTIPIGILLTIAATVVSLGFDKIFFWRPPSVRPAMPSEAPPAAMSALADHSDDVKR